MTTLSHHIVCKRKYNRILFRSLVEIKTVHHRVRRIFCCPFVQVLYYSLSETSESRVSAETLLNNSSWNGSWDVMGMTSREILEDRFLQCARLCHEGMVKADVRLFDYTKPAKRVGWVKDETNGEKDHRDTHNRGHLSSNSIPGNRPKGSLWDV